MKYSNVNEAVAKLKELEMRLSALNHASGIIYHDASTVAPSDTAQGRGVTLGILSTMEYELISSPENPELFAYLDEHAEELDEQSAAELRAAKKSHSLLSRIPMDEYVQFSVLLNDAQGIWKNAKQNNDFASFAPTLEKIIAYNRKFAGYYNKDMKPYDALLNEFEEGMTTEVLDKFFDNLRCVIVPLIEKIQKCDPIDTSFLNKCYPIDKQREFSDYLMETLLIDRTHCGIAETEHPYTTNFNNKDVRITTHYHENDVASSMYSVIHEGGHAIYELGADDKYNHTVLAGGVSMGIHESQSRFFENIIGRSYEYVQIVFPKMKELFKDQLEGVDDVMFYKAVNKATPSLIRTEADELTYALHIMVRYEIEKLLIGGELEVKDIPAKWNALYKEYLGVDVPSDTEGCLQDSHWSGGSFGYFPSYALGSAYGAQMKSFMEKDLGDMGELIRNGEMAKIKAWLGDKIHKHASSKKPGEIFEAACGKFDPSYFTKYLSDKFTKLYGI